MRPPVIQVHDTSITAIRDDRERICPIPPVVRRSTSPIQNPDRAEIAARQEREIRKRDIHVADAVDVPRLDLEHDPLDLPELDV